MKKMIITSSSENNGQNKNQGKMTQMKQTTQLKIIFYIPKGKIYQEKLIFNILVILKKY
jgi:hypothetical protein